MIAKARRLGAIRVPRGAIFALCGLVVALPAGLAAAHSLNVDSQGRWVHQHTTTFATCNAIDGDSQLKDRFNEARQYWHGLRNETGVGVPWQESCHPYVGEQARLEARDGHYGNVGWRASALDASVGNNTVYPHTNHTHLRFNLDSLGGSQITGYIKRTLACRVIGAGLGLGSAPGNEGSNNDCMSFHGSVSERSKLDYPSNYTYSNVPGAHSISTVANAYSGHEPKLTLGGQLQQAADANEHLTEDSYTLAIEAAPSTSPDPSVALAQLKVMVDGTLTETATPACAGCPIVHHFDLDPDSLPDGPHSVEVRATDELGLSASAKLEVSVDREGQIYHAKEYTDDPAAGGELLIEEWADLTTGDSRSDDGETITTRTTVPCDSSHALTGRCAQMRQLTQLDADEDAYVVYTGVTEDDLEIGGAKILEPAAFDPGTSKSQGPLTAILEPWQSPPPLHGAEYELYESTRTQIIGPESENAGDGPDEDDPPNESVQFTHRIWIDSATALPIKYETVGPEGVVGASFFTYEERLESETAADDLFAVERTQDLVLDKDVASLGADAAGPQVDQETGETFQPQYLGTSADVAGDQYCLTTSEVLHMDESIDPTPPSDVSDDPDNALDPDPEAAVTSISATYGSLAPGEACEPGEPGEEVQPDGPSISVFSEYRPSPEATGWRQLYREEAEAIDADPEADPDSGGVMSVTVNGSERTVYAIPVDGAAGDAVVPIEAGFEPGLSVLIVGATQMTISGDFAIADVQQLANELEPQ